MAKSKILSITHVNNWTAPDGTVYYYHSVELQNGDVGKAPFKRPNEYSVGDTIEYSLNADRMNISKAESVKHQKSSPAPKTPRNYTSNGKRSKEDYLGFVYGYAKDIHIAQMTITGKKVPLSELKKNVEEMYAHIEELLNL